MRLDRLNMAALMARPPPAGTDDNPRRRFLKLLGLSPVTFVPGSGGLAAASAPALDTVHSKERICFIINGETVWELDTRWFSGRPRLEVRQTPDSTVFTLTGARFPGTDISADLTCSLRRKDVRLWLHLELHALSYRIDVPFEDWLSGDLRGAAALSDGAVEYHIGAFFLSSPDEVYVSFSPDWMLYIQTAGELRIHGDGTRLTGDSACLTLARADEESLLKPGGGRRTRLCSAPPGTWSLDTELPAPEPGRLEWRDGVLDSFIVETREHNPRRVETALATRGPVNGTSLSYLPGPGLRGPAGKPFELGLRDVAFARTYGPGPAETTVLARFAAGAACLHRTNGVVSVADGDHDEPGFQAVFSGRRLQDFLCAPALRSVSATMPGAVSAPMMPTRPARLSFLNGGAIAVADAAQATTSEAPKLKLRKVPAEPAPESTEKRLQTTPRLKVAPETDKKPLQPKLRPTLKPEVNETAPKAELKLAPEKVRPGEVHLPDLSVPVIRTEDFLSLTFQFVNLSLDPAGASRLVRAEARKPAYVVAVFPPQNIYEEAIFEDASGATTKPPPMKTRLAGNSRLVFAVPSDVQAIPFALESLLEACGRFELSVPRNALPPPQVAELSLRSSVADLKSRTMRGQVRTPQLRIRDDDDSSQGARATLKLDLGRKITSLAPGGPDKNKPPGPLETAIEMPYRLWLAPHAGAAWAHALKPVIGHRGRVELWHTRLGVRSREGGVDEGNDYHRTLRAVWSPDYDRDAMPAHSDVPFRASLDARDRHEIVSLTSDFRINNYTPLPIWADRMMLTSLGAWLNSRGSWDPPCDQDAAEPSPSKSRLELLKIPDSLRLGNVNPCPPGTPPTCQGVWLTIEEWRHRATMGRDHYVRVVYKGYLFPFGHRASLIKVTERKFRPVDSGPLKGRIAAYLFQSKFIVVREPVFLYGEDERRNPFRSVRLTTLVTPKLDDPPATEIVGGAGQSAFWPTVGGKPFQFHMVATDWRGQTSDFTAPLVFLDQEWAKNPDKADSVVDSYGKEQYEDRRRRKWVGQSVAFAEVNGSNPEACTLETQSITFGAQPLDCPGGDEPAFRPRVDEAEVRVPAVEALTGGQPARIEIAQTYVDNGFAGPNAAGEVFARMLQANPLNFGADRSGGVATPNINIAGLSRKNGPVGGDAGDDGADSLADFADGKFDPKKFFAGSATEAMLLGGIRLFELFSSDLTSDDAPKLANTPIYENDELVAVETSLVWEPPVEPQIPIFEKDKGGTTSFRLDARIVNRLEGGEPDFIIEGRLTNFAVNLLGGVQSFLVIEFESFEFNATGGSKTDVTPKIRDVRFEGPLKYVNELSKYTASASGGSEGGASGGMNIEVSPAGVTAGANVSIPTITAGVMTLQNIAFTAGITVPFSGDPMRARFAFCDKENPFLMTIYCFGGGGYVGLSVGVDGVEQLELVFEFGASLALDIGVASGGVEVVAGIYINVENDECSLTGYLRMNGELNVLAIIRLSIEFYLGLEYDGASNKAWGECRLTVEIEILFFSASVTMKVRRELSEPTYLPFRSMMSNEDWTAYCDAFA